MSKFKVGDKVVFAKKLINGEVYDGFTYQSQIMPKDTVFEVLDIQHGSGEDIWYGVKTSSKMRVAASAEMIELSEQPRREFIVIRRSGAETIAELRHDREVIKSAKATCAPSDTFDLDTGAKLAFNRLMGREEPKIKIVGDEHHGAPQPAHRFKVGERVVTEECGVGEIVAYHKNNNPNNEYCVSVEKNGMHSGRTFADRIIPAKHEGKCRWFSNEDISPAPEPPKFYTGKVFAAEELKQGYPSRIGRIFEFVDGNCINSTSSDCILKPYASFEEICKELNYTKWYEVESDV